MMAGRIYATVLLAVILTLIVCDVLDDYSKVKYNFNLQKMVNIVGSILAWALIAMMVLPFIAIAFVAIWSI